MPEEEELALGKRIKLRTDAYAPDIFRIAINLNMHEYVKLMEEKLTYVMGEYLAREIV